MLLIDKPAGISSHSVVAAVRRVLGKGSKVGHAGTLDPFATGLMLVLVGRGTRTAQFATLLDKRYETLAQLGARSTTGDPEGEVEWTGNVPSSPLTLPTGRITQRPPAYSAIKIDGERAYKRARRGEEVIVPEREVTVYEFEELSREGDQVRLALRVSSGTYVRTLVEQLGDGYCLELRRTAVGPFSIDDAVTLDELDAELLAARLRPLTDTVPYLPRLDLDQTAGTTIAHGRTLSSELAGGETGPMLAVDPAGAVAIVQADGEQIKAVVGFRA